MKKLTLSLLVFITVLSGCATFDGGYDGGGRQYSRTYNSSQYARNNGVLGMSGSDTGAIGGGLVGAVIGQKFGGIGQAVTTFGGMVLGSLVGKQYDTAAAARGYTNCNWRYSGSVDPSGQPHQQNGAYDCNGGNSTVGNHNYPPFATPQ